MIISKRFPGWSSVSAVYAVIVVFIYGWTIYWFIWSISSWIYYLTLKEIFFILTYSLAVNLLESLLLLLVILGIFFALPKKWMSDNNATFVLFGGILSVLIAIWLYFFERYTVLQDAFSSGLLIKFLAGFLMLIPVSLLLCRPNVISGFVLVFADRAKIFLYLTIPASSISLCIILIRLFILH